MLCGFMTGPRCFFWIASRPAARALAMTRGENNHGVRDDAGENTQQIRNDAGE
jgi:hypothetical protein